MKKLNQLGSSMLQTVIMSAVLMVMSLAVLNQIRTSLQEQKHIVNKVEFSGTQAFAKDIMTTVADCNCQVEGKIFNSQSASPSFSLDRITTSCVVGAPLLVKSEGVLASAQVDVTRLEVKDIVPTGNANEFFGYLNISSPISANRLRSIRPSPIKFMFHTVPTSPANAKIVRGCGYAPIATPLNLVAHVGPGTGVCSFTWNASVSGRKPLTYTVRGNITAGAAATGPFFCETSDGSLACSIRNLTVGQAHHFAIQASNPYQDPSPFSSEVTCVPAQEPSVPVITAASQDRACNITWPASTGTAPIRYTVYQSQTYPVTEASTRVCTGIPGTTCLAGGLTNEQTYYYATKAENVAGSSALSEIKSCVPDRPPYCYIALQANRAITSISCPAGYESMRAGYGCNSAGMYEPFEFRGNKYRLRSRGSFYSSGDHFAHLFDLYNDTKGVIAFYAWWDHSCYYFYHGKAIYGNWPWNVCCQ